LGAEADVTGRSDGVQYDASALRGDDGGLRPGDVRWLSPLALWTGILAGPVVWAIDLTASYALAKWTCLTGRRGILHAIMFGSLLIVAGGAVVSSIALRHAAGDEPTDGGRPRQRARFMAILGLTVSALLALQIVSTAIPQWVLDACE
jgi:hypothetical protein